MSVTPESGGPAGGSLAPWRPLSVIPSVLAVLRCCGTRGSPAAARPANPEDVVPGDRALAAVGLVWTAPCGPAAAEP
ncbi:hypothetical protein [Streptomyces sp. NPDC048411]|uniref:hypothetical protein n=1 Tax=Streptomyces sp. NPDC048411 TaxID=3157206 RepID=UPI0034512898